MADGVGAAIAALRSGGSTGGGSRATPRIGGGSKLRLTPATLGISPIAADDEKDLSAGGKKAKKALDRILNDPTVPQEWKDKAKKVADGADQGGGGILGKIPLIGGTLDHAVQSLSPVFTALSIPQRVVLGGVDLAADALEQPLHGKRLDLSDALSQYGKHLTKGYDYGQFEQDHPALGAAVNPAGELVRAAGGGRKGNKWTNIAGDLAGAVATDPLTYATLGGGTVVEGGGKAAQVAKALEDVGDADKAVDAGRILSGVGRKLSREEIASRLRDVGSPELLDTVADTLRRGRYAPTGDELRQAGIEARGLGVYVPGTRTAARLLRNPDIAKQIELVGYDTLSPTAAKLGEVGSKIRDASFTKHLSELVGKNPELRQALRSGDTETAINALDTKQALKYRGLQSSRLEAELVPQANRITKAIKSMGRHGLEPSDLMHAVEGDGQAAARVATAAKAAGLDFDPVKATADMFEHARGRINDLAGVEAVQKVESYFPGLRTEAYRDLVGDKSLKADKVIAAKPGSPAWFENHRIEQFGGQNIADYQAEAAAAGRTLTRKQAIQEIFDKHFGPTGVDVADVFQTDPRVVLPAWLRAVTNRAGTAAVEGRLREAGLLRPLETTTTGALRDQREADRALNVTRQPVHGEETVGEHGQRMIDQGLAAGERTPDSTDLFPGYSDDPQPVIENVAHSDAVAATAFGSQQDAAEAADTLRHMADNYKATQGTKAAKAGLSSAADAADEAAKIADPTLRASVTVDVERGLLQAELAGEAPLDLGWANTRQGRGAVVQALTAGFERWGHERLGEQLSGDAADWFRKATEGVERGKFGKHIDNALSVWKAWAVTSPGFHTRNALGGLFNNWMDGMDGSAYGQFARAEKALRGGNVGKLSAADRQIITDMERAGTLTMHGQVGSELLQYGETVGPGARLRNVLGNNVALRANRRVGEKVEHFLRNAVIWDTLKRGGNMDAALERMFHLHFDYTDLGRYEKTVFRRVVPFWTWNSRNLGLMSESVFRHPAAFNRYGQAKQAIEDNSGVPSLPLAGYIKQLNGIFIGNGPGGPKILTPDLPFNHVGKQLSGLGTTAGLLQDANPMLKVPLELWANKQAFTGQPIEDVAGQLNPLPRALDQPGLRELLDALGVAHTGRGGQQLISPKAQYLLDQFPLEARGRKLMPSQATGNPVADRSASDRFATNLLSLLGVGVRTNDQATVNGDQYDRADRLQALINGLKSRGYLQPDSGGSAAPARFTVKRSSRKRTAKRLVI